MGTSPNTVGSGISGLYAEKQPPEELGPQERQDESDQPSYRHEPHPS